MAQSVSTVLAANEVMKLSGPGAVKVAAVKSVAISTVQAGPVAKSLLATTVTASSIAPLLGLAVVVGGLVLMTKMATNHANSQK